MSDLVAKVTTASIESIRQLAADSAGSGEPTLEDKKEAATLLVQLNAVVEAVEACSTSVSSLLTALGSPQIAGLVCLIRSMKSVTATTIAEMKEHKGAIAPDYSQLYNLISTLRSSHDPQEVVEEIQNLPEEVTEAETTTEPAPK